MHTVHMTSCRRGVRINSDANGTHRARSLRPTVDSSAHALPAIEEGQHPVRGGVAVDHPVITALSFESIRLNEYPRIRPTRRLPTASQASALTSIGPGSAEWPKRPK